MRCYMEILNIVTTYYFFLVYTANLEKQITSWPFFLLIEKSFEFVNLFSDTQKHLALLLNN